ncbi:MAG: ammonia channel protein, partial [Proteobacteria bacterium]|nr:ammonia channel protein [Pseudomonadota bacterium]
MIRPLRLKKGLAATASLLAMVAPAVALADEGPVLNSGDTAWMLTSTALVLFMTIPGLSLFYAGMVRSKNALSVMMQGFVITCLITVLWVVYLYALAFGNDVGGLIGNLDKAFHNGISFDTLKGT